MVCNNTRPTAAALFTEYQTLFQNTVLGGGDAVPESNEWYAISMNYAMAEKFYAVTEQSWKERDPRQACCDNLVAMAALDGVYPAAATPAQGYVVLEGTVGTVLPVPLTFTIDGFEFVTAVDASQPTAIGAQGTAAIRVRASIPGASVNNTATTATLDTAVAGVTVCVDVCPLSFCAGSDAEECETFRTRYLKRVQYQPRATNAWITAKLLEWPCATRAIARAGTCCQCGCDSTVAVVGSAGGSCEDCGCVDCGGKSHYYLMFDNSFENGIAPESVITEAETWLFGSPQGYGLGQVELGVCGRIVPVVAVNVDVSVDVAGCPNDAVLASVNTLVAEFFTTLQPSMPVRTTDLSSSLSRTLGVEHAFEVYFTMTTSTDGYGPLAGDESTTSKVYITGCQFEPDCDYMLVPNSLTITHTSAQQGGCPS